MSDDPNAKVLEIVEAIRTEAQTRDSVHTEAQKRMETAFAEASKRADDAVTETRKIAAVEAALTAIETRLARSDLSNPADQKRSEHQDALSEYLVRGSGRENVPVQYRAATEGTDSQGGFLVTPELDMAIAGLARDMNPMRSVATVRSGTAPAIRLVRQTSKGSAGWVSEAGSRAETATPLLGTTDIVAHELYAAPRATQTILEDSAQIEAWLIGIHQLCQPDQYIDGGDVCAGFGAVWVDIGRDIHDFYRRRACGDRSGVVGGACGNWSGGQLDHAGGLVLQNAGQVHE
ncbi:phage major capsid protein [Asticcacaulis sp. AC402]|uniref:phage major capsid protein n=1 Tax=Asticcacaulis sp. AC402 TaxID=1282361 RepID=UPI0003C404C4|nr:phage major capsid protein [Asticcacaulis sp. AC402]ESQ73473.1 hypothetical protein ABAC402_19040 [Asticcacaulis sp. AC402]